jgi:hypothetical protein
MMIRAALVFLLSFYVCQPAAAQSVSGRVAWYGLYTVSDSKEIKDPTSPTGSRFISTPIAPTSNTTEIPGKQIRFGMSYVLSGNGGNQATVKHVYRFPAPGMPDNVAGGMRTTYEFVRKANMGENVLMGWSFEGASPEQIVLGEWILEVWTNNRKVVEKHFNVVSP